MALRTKALLVLTAVLGIIPFAGIRGLADQPTAAPSAAIGLYALPSTATINPTHNPGDTWFQYTYTISSGAALNDSIPILVCLDASSGTANGDWSDEVATKVTGAFDDSVALSPSAWSFNQNSTVATTHTLVDPGCTAGTIFISIAAGTLVTPGGYQAIVHFDLQNGTPSNGPSKLKDTFSQEKLIHLFVNVIPEGSTNRAYCFMTDSEGEFLQKCDGSPANVSGGADGTFAIVANKKKIEVATNPGQFYYNLLCINDTGSDQVVNVAFDPLGGVSPHGKQALHWATFLTSTFSGVSPTSFDQAIDGNPAGASGPIPNVTVPAGHTLYVTYHLEYSGVGAPVPATCGIGCAAANQGMLVRATVTGAFGSDQCSAGGAGYLKP